MEFKLSEKGFWRIGKGNIFLEEDVKEFIRLLKEEIDNYQEDYANLDIIQKHHALEIIDKLAGEKFR